MFHRDDLTAWVSSAEQSFKLDVQGKNGLFSYKLLVSHHPDIRKQRIEHEQLLLDNRPLFEFTQGDVQLYHDDHTAGPKYSFDQSVSGLATIVERQDNKKLTEFKKRMKRIFVISLRPKAMRSETGKESD
ncbi:hypothetical protein QUF72_03020 [Desulfobacterales bacterium HSG2]|nr:hypothetical protein [Desulfobacterales bacterium HSG2]